MPETQDAREEAVNGEIRLMPPNKMPHPKIVGNLTVAFLRQLDLKAAQFFGSTFGLVIRREPLTCRSPETAVFDRSTMVEQDGYVHSAPQLAIEVLSPSETSPEAAHVQVLLIEEGKLRRSAILAEGVLKPKYFPNVQIDISEIWQD
jgi:Uma2 family endonuclease